MPWKSSKSKFCARWDLGRKAQGWSLILAYTLWYCKIFSFGKKIQKAWTAFSFSLPPVGTIMGEALPRSAAGISRLLKIHKMTPHHSCHLCQISHCSIAFCALTLLCSHCKTKVCQGHTFKTSTLRNSSTSRCPFVLLLLFFSFVKVFHAKLILKVNLPYAGKF